jgi:hypothetical protein
VRQIGDFRRFVVDVPSHEAPMLIALRELILAADERGGVAREALVEAFRTSYLALYGETARPGSAESRRLFEISRMTVEEVDAYLGEQVLGRLESEGLLEQNGDGGQVAVASDVWHGKHDHDSRPGEDLQAAARRGRRRHRATAGRDRRLARAQRGR